MAIPPKRGTRRRARARCYILLGLAIALGACHRGAKRKVHVRPPVVGVPAFQYGIFSEGDLSFFGGGPFNFGGRVATNGNLFLAAGTRNFLILGDQVTAFKDVVRAQLSNGVGISPGSAYDGEVDVPTTAGGCAGAPPPPPGACRALAINEGSVTGGPGSPPNPNWRAISLTTYNGYIRNGQTGARRLNLAMAPAGASPIAMIQRPVSVPPGAFEDPAGIIGRGRFFNQASLRVLISDTPDALTNLPGATASTPLRLDAALNAGDTPTLPTDSCHPPVALSPGFTADHDYMSPVNTTLLGGNIKIEIQLASSPGTWQDVTAEILNLGISRDVQLSGAGSCANNISILHLERVKPGITLNTTAKATAARNFVPINMYDPREGEVRDIPGPRTVSLNGVMNIVEIDVGNLQKWFANTLCRSADLPTVPPSCSSGALAYANSGYIVYFSDRRGNRDLGANETGEYGNEDIINPDSAQGAPNGLLDPGEDVDGDGVLQTYGATPHPIAIDNSLRSPWPAFMTTVTPLTRVSGRQGEKNSVVFFRRALRLVNGTLGNLPPLARANCTTGATGGFTVAAENPVYVQGDFNASVASKFNDASNAVPPLCHVPAAVIGDAVTLLSNSWSDANSFASPTDAWGRPVTGDTWYRMAVMGGKNNSFPKPTTWGHDDAGTDGGVHNFLRMIEDWGAATLNYRGSLVSLYVSRQATGIYKCCRTVYNPPRRAYSFDTDFMDSGKLPPGTPRLRD